MKWVTREHAKVDRIAYPWLVMNFVDKNAEFLFVPRDKVMKVARMKDAIPFDVPEVELGHHGDECSFDSLLKKYELGEKDSSLLELPKIVRGTDTQNRNLTPQSEGLGGIATGFSHNSRDDHDNMNKQFYMYDALHTFCKLQRQEEDI